MAKQRKRENKRERTKEERLLDNVLKTTKQYITGKGYNSPLSEKELMQRLCLPPQHEELFSRVLQKLIEENTLELRNGRYSIKQQEAEVVSGVLRVHPRGFGFLQLDDPKQYPEDIFIPKHLTMNAVDGDQVEVVVNLESLNSEKGPEGKVISIVERSRTHIAGIVHTVDPQGDVWAYVPLLGTGRRVLIESNREQPLIVGDRVVLEVLDWGSKEKETVCSLSQRLGHISDPTCDISAAIEEYQIRKEFPKKVLQEAESFGNRVSLKELAHREDLRDTECFTIDPQTAKDFDDAVSLKKDKKGNYHLGVHISDVSHYVKPGSALDKEAILRCNSTYFPGTCIPMLPSVLSDNLCSLKANVNRLTVSALMTLDSKGNLLDYRIVRTMIKSAKRFSYEDAKKVLDGVKKSPHKPTLELMVELCYVLKRKRYERGSIEFSIPELVVVVDEKGSPQGTKLVEYDITHQLIEEFMLKANEVVALHLNNLGKNLTYRIHDEPAEENIRDFGALAHAFGFKLPEKPTPSDLQKLFDEAVHTPYGPFLATSFIRRMRLAVYSAENIGHYGLALTHYCHFTSPIRRYVDLVVHRILFGESDERKSIENIALRCSEQERISAKSENSVRLLKKLRLLLDIHAKEPQRRYDAVVTRVKNFGFFFEVLDLMLEGFLHVSELDNDYFIFEESRMRLRGSHTGTIYASGDRITVMLKSADLIYQESYWYLVPDDGEERKKEKPVAKLNRAERRALDQSSKKTSKKPKAAGKKSGKRKSRRSQAR